MEITRTIAHAPIVTAKQTFILEMPFNGSLPDKDLLFYADIVNDNTDEINVYRNYYNGRNEFMRLSAEEQKNIENFAKEKLTEFVLKTLCK